MSVLLTCSTTLKFVNALNKLSLSYRLVIKYSTCTFIIELVYVPHGQQWRKPAPPMLKNYPLATKSTFMVFRMVDQKFVKIIFTSFLYAPYKVPPSINNIFTHVSFYCTLFHGLAGACMNPTSFSLNSLLRIHLFVK